MLLVVQNILQLNRNNILKYCEAKTDTYLKLYKHAEVSLAVPAT
jgi:hypothetical protein